KRMRSASSAPFRRVAASASASDRPGRSGRRASSRSPRVRYSDDSREAVSKDRPPAGRDSSQAAISVDESPAASSIAAQLMSQMIDRQFHAAAVGGHDHANYR